MPGRTGPSTGVARRKGIVVYVVETQRTADVGVRERGDWWRERISAIHCPFSFDLPDDYGGRVEHQRSHTYQVVRWWGDAEDLTRRDTQIRRHPHGVYELLVPLRGHLDLAQDGRTARVAPSEMILASMDRPLDLRHGDGFSCVAFVIPRDRMEARVPGALRLGAGLAAGTGLGRIAVDLLMSLRAQRHALDGAQFDAIADRVVDLVALAHNADTTAVSADVQEGLVAAVRRVVRENAQDPTLTGAVVAARLGWSLRHIQTQLRRGGTTPSDLIREERLALARLRLQDPGWRHQSITQVAYASGFGDLSTFSNSYRRAFGERPSDTRDTRRPEQPVCARDHETARHPT